MKFLEDNMVAEILLLFRLKVTFRRSFSTRKTTSLRKCRHTSDGTTSTKPLLKFEVQDLQSAAPAGATAAKCCEKRPGAGLVRDSGLVRVRGELVILRPRLSLS